MVQPTVKAAPKPGAKAKPQVKPKVAPKADPKRRPAEPPIAASAKKRARQFLSVDLDQFGPLESFAPALAIQCAVQTMGFALLHA